MPRLLITGAGGFVGAATCRRALAEGWEVHGTVRRHVDRPEIPEGVHVWATGDLGERVNWTPILDGVDTVIHLAGVPASPDAKAARACRRVNTEGTLVLARACAEAGTRRLVYSSSIKVLGEESGPSPFGPSSEPAPADAYAESKLEAERGLARVAARSSLETVIVRPPMVYGPGVGGNLPPLLRALYRRVPLPLGLATNRRSLIGAENLADILLLCARRTGAARKIFLVADTDQPLRDTVRALADGMGRRAILLPVPPGLARAAGRLLGRQDTTRRLFGSLYVDSSPTREALSWTPRVPAAEGLAETGRWFRSSMAAGTPG